MRYGPLWPYAGARPLQEYFLPANDVGNPDAPPAAGFAQPTFMPPGVVVPGFDNYWGGVEFLYGQASATVAVWAPVAITPAVVSGRWQHQFAGVANTANQARPAGISIQQMAANQFGWIAIQGLLPVLCTASVAAGNPLGITGAGTLGASSAGKEVENCVVIAAATTTVIKNGATLQSNSPILQFTGNNTIDGAFVGAALSGTNIAANAVVQTLDPDGRRVTMSTGPGVLGAALNAQASGAVNVTVTYNDGTNFYNIVHIDRPFYQGRIT